MSCAGRRIIPWRPRSGPVRPRGSGRWRMFCPWRRVISGRARSGPVRARGFGRWRTPCARRRIIPARPWSGRVRTGGLARRRGRRRLPLGLGRWANALGTGQEARTHPRFLGATGRRRCVGRRRVAARLYAEGLSRRVARAGIGVVRRGLACFMGGWAGWSGIGRTFHCDPRMGKVGRGRMKPWPRDRINAYLASDSSSGAATKVLQPYLPRAWGRDLAGST